MSIESAPLPHFLEALFRAHFIAERVGEAADDIAILIRKTKQEMMRG